METGCILCPLNPHRDQLQQASSCTKMLVGCSQVDGLCLLLILFCAFSQTIHVFLNLSVLAFCLLSFLKEEMRTRASWPAWPGMSSLHWAVWSRYQTLWGVSQGLTPCVDPLSAASQRHPEKASCRTSVLVGTSPVPAHVWSKLQAGKPGERDPFPTVVSLGKHRPVLGSWLREERQSCRCSVLGLIVK